MLRFRPKLGSERGSEWRCFFCLHVRTGTVLLGSWHMLLHMIALGFVAALVRDPKLIQDLERSGPSVSDSSWRDVGDRMPTALSNMDVAPTPYQQYVIPRDHSYIYLCTLAITVMLIYGATRGRPAHLLPFFCLQIFDFAITVLTTTGYVCYLRSAHRLLPENVPWRAELMKLSAPALALLILGVFFVAVFIKGYCIGVVWRCYKYLTLRNSSLQNLTPFVISTESVVTAAPYVPPAPDYSSLLPDYEEAVKQTPPPSYLAATLLAGAEPAIVTPETLPGEVAPPLQQSAAAAPASPAAPAAHTVVILPQPGAPASV